MSQHTPRYLLFSGAVRRQDGGSWHFQLESIDGSQQLDVSDDERHMDRDRLELLALVRGLEALDQPSLVTLVTASRYINHGLRVGLPAWRENGWRWEHFGKMVPVPNQDLWQRVDWAMQFHGVDCRVWRLDEPASGEPVVGAPVAHRARRPAVLGRFLAGFRRGWRQLGSWLSRPLSPGWTPSM